MLSRTQAWLLTILLLAALEPVSWLTAPIPPCIINPSDYGSYYAENNECPSLHVFLIKLGASIFEIIGDPHWLTAIATVVIGAFTGTLWWATKIQGKLTRDSIQLARDEFNATHRPKIVVHFAEMKRFPDPQNPDASELDYLGITLLCFNKGRGAAKNVKIRGDILVSEKIPDAKIMRPEIEPPIESVESGIKIWVELNSGRPIQDVLAFRTKGSAFFVGAIVYFDQNERRRETGFCFVFDTQSMRWKSAQSPEHEYAY